MSGRVPTYEEFAERAKAIAAAIPSEFTADVEDMVVHRGAKRHPQIPDIVTLGECESSPLAAMTGSGLVRSIVHLWYGSFVDLARRDEGFDVDAELRETIEHEIKHHLEDKAGTRSLEDEDDLFDAHQRFLEGLDVPAGWYRFGRLLEPHVWAVDLDLFVELRLRRKEFEALRGKDVSMTILGEPFEAEVPADAVPGAALTYEGEGLVEHEGHEPASAPAEGEEPEAGSLHLIPLVR